MTQTLIDQAAKALSKKPSETFQDFMNGFYRQAQKDDLLLMDPALMAMTVETHWELSNNRKKGVPAIRIHTPPIGHEDSPMGYTVIDIVNDDMAFLVASVAAELARHGHLIHLLLHPVLSVKATEADGVVLAKIRKENDSFLQSHIHIELQDTLLDSMIPQLEKDLLRVLTDVRRATRDWKKMRSRMRACQKDLSMAPARFSDVEIEEYLAFLEYIYKDNFTFLGSREYSFENKGGRLRSVTVPGSSLGLLGDDVRPVYISESKDGLPEELQKLRRNLPPLTIGKVNKRSTVHRAVPLDAIAVKKFDEKGKVCGEYLFVGLFTSVTYSRSVEDIPYLRRKVDQVMHKSGFEIDSHDYKALRHILEKYPRDELFQIDVDDLVGKGQSILRLQERQRIALYMRPDSFGRYISCLVYVPKDRYDTSLRLEIQKILEAELEGQCGDFYTTMDDSPLARVMFIMYTSQLDPPKYDVKAIEAKLQYAGRLWSEKLAEALPQIHEDYDDKTILFVAQKYGDAFPAHYQTRYSAKQSVHDIDKIEEALEQNRLRVDLYHSADCRERELRVKLYNPGAPVILSDVLPILENMGLYTDSEWPYEIKPQKASQSVWVHDFLVVKARGSAPVDVDVAKENFEQALVRIWYQQAENDALNDLVLSAQMNWRELTILRSYVRYLRQVGVPYETRFIERTLAANAVIARALIDMFFARFDLSVKEDRESLVFMQLDIVEKALEDVPSLEEDRILRSMTSLVLASLRTNFFQTDGAGEPKPYLSIKFDSGKISDLPEPRPYREIFVYSPRVEGVHLRADAIARGGLRWSDRHEDFRTEILGLMKAQQVKNSVIVPMGAKGGFVVKQPPNDGGREAYLAEGIECYKTFICGLLDITDNRVGTKVAPPENVVRWDDDDPYLVVAADKGTATFSDIANGLSREYGFWLDDAFASGGSAGYDHKKMGITARGAWESVKRHFRELGHDTQSQPFDVVGVGDMGGDVFGNGMLLSRHIRLIGAFNHLHIFCDPDPDPEAAFKERKRLFKGVKGWGEYNTKLLSAGGRIYERSKKSLTLTPQIRKRFGIDKERVTPAELIKAMLRAETDLLWFGGIGTYIKASGESHAAVGDKTNDSLRIDARDVRASVIGEGANLAITQRGRIEFSNRGGRINADFIDNSGGVDSSDHEVNIKILFSDLVRGKKPVMTIEARNKILEAMTDEVAGLVLSNNYQQAQGISLMELQAAGNLSTHESFIQDLEKTMNLSRKLEGLPDEEEIASRSAAGKGLNRPELCILQSYAKLTFTQDLLQSDIPDQAEMKQYLVSYFPKQIQDNYQKQIFSHRLGREIISTIVANDLVNRMGPTFVKEQMERTGASAADVARAFIIVREAFCLRDLWDRIEALDNKVDARIQLAALKDIAHMAERETRWFLTRLGRSPSLGRDIEPFRAAVAELQKNLDQVVAEDIAENIAMRRAEGESAGLPKGLAHRIALIPTLSSACDIIRTALDHQADLLTAARIYFELGEHFHLEWLRGQTKLLSPNDHWSAEALSGIIDHLNSCQTGMTSRVLNDMKSSLARGKAALARKGGIVRKWIETHDTQAHQLDPLFADIRRMGTVDLPMLVIAEQRLRNLYGG